MKRYHVDFIKFESYQLSAQPPDIPISGVTPPGDRLLGVFIYFEDYSPDERTQLFGIFCKKSNFNSHEIRHRSFVLIFVVYHYTLLVLLSNYERS